MKLYMLRHGQSVANADHDKYFDYLDHEIPLSELGIEQAAAAGRVLNDELGSCQVFVSPYLRARATWEIMLANMQDVGIGRVAECPTIREQEYKVFEGKRDLTKVNKAKEAFGAYFYRYKRGESQADVYDRALAFYAYLKTLGEGAPIVIVSHEIFLRSLMMVIDGTSPDITMGIRLGNCEIHVREV